MANPRPHRCATALVALSMLPASLWTSGQAHAQSPQPGTAQTNPAPGTETSTAPQPPVTPKPVEPQPAPGASTQPAGSNDTSAAPDPVPQTTSVEAASTQPTPKEASPKVAPPPNAEVIRQAELDKATEEEVPCVRIFTQEQNRRTVLVGNILTGVGGASFAASAVMFSLAFDRHKARDAIEPGTNQPEVDERIDELERQRRGLIIAGIVTGASSVALLAAGPPIMAVGYRREKARQGAQFDVPSLGFSRQRGRNGSTATRVDLALGMRF